MATQTRETLSSGRSIWLRVVAWLYKLSGSLFVFVALFTLIAGREWSPSPDRPSYAMSVLLRSAMAAGLLATGILLARRARTGAFLALAITLYPFAYVVAGLRPFVWFDIVAPVITVAVIASIWPELSSHNTPSRVT